MKDLRYPNSKHGSQRPDNLLELSPLRSIHLGYLPHILGVALVFAAAIQGFTQCVPITITNQPQSAVSAPCSTNCVTFSVGVTGTTPTYQWYFNESPISDADSPSYTVCPVTSSNAGDYYVMVTNACSTRISSIARLTVGDTTPPTIVCPSNMTVYTCAANGEQVEFTVEATDDLSSNVVVVCDPPSGNVFPLGTNLVVCTAFDDCGNINRCVFTVAVLRGADCVDEASSSGGGSFPCHGGVEVTSEELARLMQHPLPIGEGPGDDLDGDVAEILVQSQDSTGSETGEAQQGPSPAYALSQTPPLTDFFEANGLANGIVPPDPTLAVSSTHIVVGVNGEIGMYTKDGKKAIYNTHGDPVGNGVLTWSTLFSPMNLGPLVSNYYRQSDLRVLFDEYRKRFWVLTRSGNTLVAKTNRYLAHAVALCAVSKTENPLDGWYLYWWNTVAHWGMTNDTVWNSSQGADYQIIGIDPLLFHHTIDVYDVVTNATSTNKIWRYEHVVFFSADQLANGQPANGWEFYDLQNGDGSFLGNAQGGEHTQPAIHHGSTGRSYWVSRHGTNKLEVFALTDPFTPQQHMHVVELTIPFPWSKPGNAPQKGSTGKIQMWNLGTSPLKAVYRNGLLHVVTPDAYDWFGDGEELASIRLLRMFVLNYPTIPTVGDPNWINRRFGKNSSLDDPPDARVHYGWPCIEVNRYSDMAIVYARSGDTIYPEARYSTYLDAESDIRPSRIMKVGEGPYGASGLPNRWGDLAGASVDPYDDTGIWMVHEYANASGGYGIWVGKVFGKVYTDWRLSGLHVSLGNLKPGSRMDISGRLANQGDGTSSNTTVALYLIGAGTSILLNEISEPAMGPGEETEFSIDGMVPAGISPCDFQIQVVIDPEGENEEYSKANNSVFVQIFPRLEIMPEVADNTLSIRVFGQEQCNYTLQGTMDFQSWDDLTSQPVKDGSFTFNVDRTAFPYRFFRAVKSL